jgi:hypothetical protein
MSTSQVAISSIYDNSLLSSISPNAFSSGTSLNVSWSNYLFSTFNLPSVYAQTNVNIKIGSDPAQIFGPYIWPISSVSIAMPTTTLGFNSSINTLVQSYVVGQQNYASQSTIICYNPGP